MVCLVFCWTFSADTVAIQVLDQYTAIFVGSLILFLWTHDAPQSLRIYGPSPVLHLLNLLTIYDTVLGGDTYVSFGN